tara:strand:+ start:339 stop:3185 length:2847 start_codon:yes stop_codon:yes gene_type:complete
MNYLQWNNAIGHFFFNEEKAEQEVYLFISKHDLIKVGRGNGLEGDDESIFLDYIAAIRKGISGRILKGNILEHALYAYDKWQENPVKIDNVPVKYPLYICYLTLFVLPLTENSQPDLRVDAYYPRIKSFLKKYDLPSMPTQNEYFNWNSLWEDLFDWSFEERNTELGYYEVHPFQNERWVYVGKPLSQSIFPIHAIRQLPQFFETSGLVPGEEIDGATLRNLLLASGERHLGLPGRVLNAIRDSKNELGHSIISVVKKNYQEWTGDTDLYDSDTETIKKGNTISQLRLCIEGDRARGYKTYYRLYTKLDFPEDLTFTHEDREYKCQQFGKGWSKPLFLPFNEGMELQDSLNKWKAKFPEKDVRLFIEGKNFHLSGWVEVPYMVSTKMLLLAKDELSASIEEWGDCFAEGDFKKVPRVEIADSYTLYELSNPPIGHPDIPVLQFKTDKRIALTGGIKIGVRTWLIDLLPDIELENGRGTETVFLAYENDDKKIPLMRKDIDQPVWSLPQDIKINKGFALKVEGDDIRGDQLKNYIVDSQGKVEVLDEDALPARNKFGQIINSEESDSYVIGSKLLADDERKLWLRQALYSRDFRPQITKGKYLSPVENDFTGYNNLLVSFLTVKGKSSSKDYFEAFESVYQEMFGPEEIESHPIELSRLKRWSLNYLDYMGILDYEYSTKKIVVNPPQFLLIPTYSGRKVLLIGGRTSELMQKVKAEAEKEGLHLNLEPQDTSLSPFILPPTVSVTGFDENDGIRIERKLRKVAEACSISFDPNKLPQFRLAEFSGNIDDYKSQLTPDERFDDSGWPARVFNVNQLRFIPTEIQSIDKSFSLVEYRLTEYSFKHRLWMNGHPYDINKNWGRFMILNHYKKEVIFNDRGKNIVAIPAALPLPRLISEAMTLFSGKAPKRLFLEIQGIKTWFNIYENIPPIFASNYFRKVGQTKKELTINL